MEMQTDRMEAYLDELRAFARERYPDRAGGLVPGEGAPRARVMLIGEAPGEQEALQHRPFVGRAGKNLDDFLEGAGLDRGALYVTNTVKLRPTRLSPAGRLVNRPPDRREIADFLPWLWREIELVDPEVVVTLGNVPLRALTGGGAAIGAAHGRLIEVRGRRIYPMYHPAALIYDPSLRPVYAADIARLAERLRDGNGLRP